MLLPAEGTTVCGPAIGDFGSASRKPLVLLATWFIFDFWNDTLRRMSSFHLSVYFVWATLAGWVLTTAAVTAWGTGITKKEFLWSAAPDGGNFICLGLTQANDPKR